MFMRKMLVAQICRSDDPKRSCPFQVISCLERACRDSKGQGVSAPKSIPSWTRDGGDDD
jgi:hypothetical protein